MTDFPQLKLQANIIFPGSVSAGAGIDVALANGNYTLSLDYPDFAPPVSIAPDLSHQNVLLWNSITGTYTLASAALLVSGGSVPEAPNDGQIYGRQSLSWTPAPGSVPSNTNPLVDGVASPGTSIQFSRGDHVHPAAPVSGITQNSQSANYTTILTDAEKHIFHPSADTTARTWTIDSNANVPYPLGTAITFVNQNAAGIITLAITADTMRLAGAGTTGSRTLAANGVCTALKVTATEWIISGTGLT